MFLLTQEFVGTLNCKCSLHEECHRNHSITNLPNSVSALFSAIYGKSSRTIRPVLGLFLKGTGGTSCSSRFGIVLRGDSLIEMVIEVWDERWILAGGIRQRGAETFRGTQNEVRKNEAGDCEITPLEELKADWRRFVKFRSWGRLSVDGYG